MYVASGSLVVLVIHQAFFPISVGPSARTHGISYREQVPPASPISWFSKRGSATIFAFKFIRLLALVALSALTITATSHTGRTWCDIALTLTSVSSCFLSHHMADLSLTGLYSNTRYFQRLCSRTASSHFFIPFVHRVAFYARVVRLPRYMATDDLRCSPS